MRPQMRKITGTVTEARISRGSKSEHRAVVLRTARGDEFILRRAGGNAFRDEILEALVGTTIEGVGSVADRTFIMRDWMVTKGKG
jgi:hypothetical protein